VIFVGFLYAGAATEGVLLARLFQTDHVKNFSEVVSSQCAREIFDSWRLNHFTKILLLLLILHSHAANRIRLVLA
jgi:hypothetical protein